MVVLADAIESQPSAGLKPNIHANPLMVTSRVIVSLTVCWHNRRRNTEGCRDDKSNMTPGCYTQGSSDRGLGAVVCVFLAVLLVLRARN
jgi:hypothetical protein